MCRIWWRNLRERDVITRHRWEYNVKVDLLAIEWGGEQGLIDWVQHSGGFL